MEKLNEARWVVLFISKKRKQIKGYSDMLRRMMEKVKEIPGFIGFQSFSDEQNRGITISFWKDKPAIKQWKMDADHIVAQKRGKEDWYMEYQLIICSIADYKEFYFGELTSE